MPVLEACPFPERGPQRPQKVCVATQGPVVTEAVLLKPTNDMCSEPAGLLGTHPMPQPSGPRASFLRVQES